MSLSSSCGTRSGWSSCSSRRCSCSFYRGILTEILGPSPMKRTQSLVNNTVGESLTLVVDFVVVVVVVVVVVFSVVGLALQS